jgi:hypothetical protein
MSILKHSKTESGDRSMIDGSSAATADAASDGGNPQLSEHASTDAPHARPAKPLAENEKHDQLAEREAGAAEDRQEALLDEGLEESFPGSDPVSVKRIT